MLLIISLIFVTQKTGQIDIMVIECHDAEKSITRVNNVTDIHRIEEVGDKYYIYYRTMRSEENRLKTKWFNIKDS